MPPQFKYALIGLFILTIGVFIYVLSGNPEPPVKQAAVQPPVAKPPPPQPPQQVPPPVQPPAPTQQQLQEQQAREECTQQAEWYRQQFNTRWRTEFPQTGEDITSVLQPYLNFKGEWQQKVISCKVRTQGNWIAPFGAEVYDLPLREECNRRGRNYGGFFQTMRSMTPVERDQYVTSQWGQYGKKAYQDFVAWYDGLKNVICTPNLTGGWTAPFDESIIIRTANR